MKLVNSGIFSKYQIYNEKYIFLVRGNVSSGKGFLKPISITNPMSYTLTLENMYSMISNNLKI